MDFHAKFSNVTPSIPTVSKCLEWLSHPYLPGMEFFACKDSNASESADVMMQLQNNKHSWQWLYLWTSGMVMAKWILDNPSIVSGKTVYDLGTGQGAVAIAANKAGAKLVVGVDCCVYSEFVLNANSDRNNVKTYFLNKDILIDLKVLDNSIVFASDVVYGQHSSPHLVRKFQQLARTNKVFVAQTMRTNPRYEYPEQAVEVLSVEDAPVEFHHEITDTIEVRVMAIRPDNITP